MFEGKVLVGELFTIDRLASATIAHRKVSSLDHKVGDCTATTTTEKKIKAVSTTKQTLDTVRWREAMKKDDEQQVYKLTHGHERTHAG